jgi:hypothetical protein
MTPRAFINLYYVVCLLAGGLLSAIVAAACGVTNVIGCAFVGAALAWVIATRFIYRVRDSAEKS